MATYQGRENGEGGAAFTTLNHLSINCKYKGKLRFASLRAVTMVDAFSERGSVGIIQLRRGDMWIPLGNVNLFGLNESLHTEWFSDLPVDGNDWVYVYWYGQSDADGTNPATQPLYELDIIVEYDPLDQDSMPPGVRK